jgi:hypothetical protein
MDNIVTFLKNIGSSISSFFSNMFTSTTNASLDELQRTGDNLQPKPAGKQIGTKSIV